MACPNYTIFLPEEIKKHLKWGTRPRTAREKSDDIIRSFTIGILTSTAFRMGLYDSKKKLFRSWSVLLVKKNVYNKSYGSCRFWYSNLIKKMDWTLFIVQICIYYQYTDWAPCYLLTLREKAHLYELSSLILKDILNVLWISIFSNRRLWWLRRFFFCLWQRLDSFDSKTYISLLICMKTFTNFITWVNDHKSCH